jgi:hypothetical protein
MSASKAATTIVATQPAESKKRKRGGPTLSTDTVTVSTDIETVVADEDNTRSPDTPIERVTQMPRKVVEGEGHSRSGTGESGDAGSLKKARKAPPK